MAQDYTRLKQGSHTRSTSSVVLPIVTPSSDIVSATSHARYGHHLEAINTGASSLPCATETPALEHPMQSKATGVSAPHPDIPAATGGGQSLSAPVRRKMEGAFGHSFADVRIHSGGEAEQVGALAYTRGTDIHFQPALYDPLSLGGQELLGHELTHVIQQRAGRVSSPQPKADGVAPINADAGLEAEADALGVRAARGERAVVSGAGTGLQRKSQVDAPIQCKGFFSKLFGKCLGSNEQDDEDGDVLAPNNPPQNVPVQNAPPQLNFDDIKGVYGKSEVISPEADHATSPETVHSQFHELFQQNVMRDVPRIGGRQERLELESWKGDYEKIMELMLNKDETEKHLGPLNNRIGEMDGDNKLSRAIDSQKEEFGFSTEKKIPLGILSGEDFLKYYQTGNVPTDPGAGLAHGQHSHQLQWSAIMSKFDTDMKEHKENGSEGPAPWNHTPLELISKFQDPRFGWLQGHLMDKPGNQIGLGYRHPDSVNHNMISNQETQEKLPHLSGEVSSTFENAQRMAFEKNPRDIMTGANSALNEAYKEKLLGDGWEMQGGNAVGPQDHQPQESSMRERLFQQRQKYGMLGNELGEEDL